MLDIPSESILAAEYLWRTHKKPYAIWLCELTNAISKYGVRDEVLKLVAPLCGNSAEFAEFICPYLLEDLFNQGFADLSGKLGRNLIKDSDPKVT